MERISHFVLPGVGDGDGGKRCESWIRTKMEEQLMVIGIILILNFHLPVISR